MPRVLFVHNNFPGQFGWIAAALHRQGHSCAAIASHTGKPVETIPLLRWASKRGSTPNIFPFSVRAEADFIRGRAAAECALALRKKGFDPDLIIGHPGWGETLFLREIFPRAKQVLYGEYFYRSRNSDIDFDPEFSTPTDDDRMRVYAKNATMMLAYSEADRIVSPTLFQASQLPDLVRGRMSIIHEGVDTDLVRPDPAAVVKLKNGRMLDRSVPVVTFINRRFEPLRGYHVFMRALPRFLAEVPEAQVLLIGSDEPGGYGAPAPTDKTWGQIFLDEVRDRIDLDRVHFLGRLNYDAMLAALSVSSAHVYHTYPFVLSWSLLEAMASECLIIGSDTEPVREVITHERNGLLVDFFDADALSTQLIAACQAPSRFVDLRRAARETVLANFDRERVCKPAWMELVSGVLAQT